MCGEDGVQELKSSRLRGEVVAEMLRRPETRERNHIPTKSGQIPVGHYKGKKRGGRTAESSAGNYMVMKRKCQRMSTAAWTRAEAKMELVLRQVQP